MMTLSFPNETAGDEENAGDPNPTCSCKLDATVKIKATWTHDDATQTDTTDPAPTKVWIIETGGATWAGATSGSQPVADDGGGPPPPSPFSCSGSASDDVPGDQYIALPVGGPPSSGKVYAPPVTPPAPPPVPLGWSTQTVSGNTFTLTHTFNATGTATYSNAPAGVSATCSVGPYSITIHAQPYNFRTGNYIGSDGLNHPTRVSNNTYATLALSYLWDSTDGSKGDLASCQILENIT